MKIYINKIALSVAMLAVTFNIINVNAQSGDIDNNSNNACVTLDNNMRYKIRDASVNNEVTDLQDYLISEGYMSGQTTGYFGAGTLKAVKSFQSQNNLISSGYVGPVTRAKIKELSCGISTTTNPTQSHYCTSVMMPYYKYNTNTKSCYYAGSGTNGCYQYKSGEYKSEADCKAVNGLSGNTINNQISFGAPSIYASAGVDIIKGQSAIIKYYVNSNGGNTNNAYIDFRNVNTGSVYSIYDLQFNNGGNQYNWNDTNKTQSVNGVYSVDIPVGRYSPTLNYNGKQVIGSEFNIMSSKKINITSAYIQQYNDNQVNLYVYGTGFKNGNQIQLAGCVSGSHESLSSNSDTETSVGFDKSYLLGCIGQKSNATLKMTGYGTDNSNEYTVSIPMSITNVPTSIKAYNVQGNEMITNDAIYSNVVNVDPYSQSSKTLNKVDIIKGQYQTIEVKYSCGTMLDSNNAMTSNFGLGGVFLYGGSAGYGAFNCPEGINMMKGGSDIVTIGNIVKDVDSVSYRIDYSGSWGANVDGSKKMPTGELYFYGVDANGNKTFIKSITFLYSIKG